MGVVVRTVVLLGLLSASVGAARINVMINRDAAADDIFFDEADLALEQTPGWDRPSAAGSSALLDTTGMDWSIPLHTTGIQCEGNKNWQTGVRWTAGLSIAHGSNGEVIQVSASNSNKSEQYVIKIPFRGNESSAQQLENEAAIMEATTASLRTGNHPECQHVAPVLDSRPCLDDVLILTGAYVTLKMEMDLHQWYVKYALRSEDVREFCQGTIARQLADGLSCLHSAGTYGFMHGDFKMDNILIESIDTETSCPLGLRVIDFGLSHELGSMTSKYGPEYFEVSVHLPDSVFEEAPDALSLSLESSQDMFYVSSDVDWCSYVYLMNSKFHYNPIREVPESASGIYCGQMGYGRRLVSGQGPLQEDAKKVEGGEPLQVESMPSLGALSVSAPAILVPTNSTSAKRKREEAEQVERASSRKVLGSSAGNSDSRHLMNWSERLRSHTR